MSKIQCCAFGRFWQNMQGLPHRASDRLVAGNAIMPLRGPQTYDPMELGVCTLHLVVSVLRVVTGNR